MNENGIEGWKKDYLCMITSFSRMILRNSSISLLICLGRRWVLDVLLLTMSTNDGLLRRLAWAWVWGKEPANRRPPDNETAMLAIWRQYHIQIIPLNLILFLYWVLFAYESMTLFWIKMYVINSLIHHPKWRCDLHHLLEVLRYSFVARIEG